MATATQDASPSRRAGRPPRAAPPQHRHRPRDRPARRGRRSGGAPGRCILPAAGQYGAG